MGRIEGDYAPDLWQTPSSEAGEMAPPPSSPAGDEEPSGEVAPLAHPKIVEALKEVEEAFLAPGGSISLFSKKFQDRETIELHEDLANEETENPFDTSKQMELGYHYLYVMQDYPKAVLAYHSALKVFDLDPETHANLGQAYFGMGEYKKSIEVYEAGLELDSRNADLRKLHIEASQKYLETLDKEKDAKEAAGIQRGIVADQAMLLALKADDERRAIVKMHDSLNNSHPQSPDEAKAMLGQVQALAQNYLAFGSIAMSGAFSDPEDAEFVQGELNSLASETFKALQSLAQNSVYEEVQETAPYYEGLGWLAAGETGYAQEAIEKVRGLVPEAAEILDRLESDRLRTVNLAALEAWDAYIAEGQAVELDEAGGLKGGLVDVLSDVFGDGLSAKTMVRDRWTVERKVVSDIRDLLTAGKCGTIREALELIAAEDDSRLMLRASPRAKAILEDIDQNDHRGSYTLQHLIRYASSPSPTSQQAWDVLEDADQLSARYSAGQTPFALLSLVEATTHDDQLKAAAQKQIASLKEGKSFGGALWDMIRTAGTDDLVQIGIMAGASKVGSFAKLATLGRLQAAGITGTRALLLAGGAEVLAEGSTLWALNTAYEAVNHDLEKVFSPEHLAASYGATIAMLPFIKVFNAAGKSAGTNLARALNLVTEGGSRLSVWGKILAGGTAHVFGAGGMINASLFNQGVGLVPVSPGGFSSTLVHEVFGYTKYAFAGGAFHGVLGAEHAQAQEALHLEIAIKEASVLTEGHLKSLGHRAASRAEDGSPVYETPEVQALFGQMTYLSLSVPGFSGETVADLISKGKQTQAADYLKSFGLKAKYDGKQLTGFEELSRHEELGVVPVVEPESDPAPSEETTKTVQMPAAARQARPLETDAEENAGLSQQEQAALAVSGIDYVYGFLDGLRREHKLSDPISPVEVVSSRPDFSKETIDLTVRKEADVEPLLDDIAAHADNLGGQKTLPLKVRAREPGKLVLETPSGRPITVRAAAVEAPASGRLYSVGGPAALYATLTNSGMAPGAAAAITGALTVVGILAMAWSGGKSAKPAGPAAVEVRPEPGKDFVVGRNAASDLVLARDCVSGVHVTFHQEGGVWYAVNGEVGQAKQSLNGFAVEGNFVAGKFAPVKDGDHVYVRTGENEWQTIVFREPAQPQPTLEAPAKNARPADWTDRKDDWKGIAAASNKGLHYKDTNEDRYVVLTSPDGRSLMVSIDGMGGHAGGERAAEIARTTIEKAVIEGKSLSDAMIDADRAIIADNEARGMTQSAPGAVAMGVELSPQADGTYKAAFAGVGDCEAVVIRPGASQPILHHTMRANALSSAIREASGNPFKTLADGRLALGQTLDLRMAPYANHVDAALGGHDTKVDVSVSEKPLRDGDIVLTGSDGLFENFGRLSVIQEVIRQSGARTASEIRDALMTESLIRMSLAENAFDKTLSHQDYVAAYREATGKEPSKDWHGMYEPWRDASGRYHTYRLDKQGVVTHAESGRAVDHFKNDNVTLTVQVVGEPVHQVP